MDFILLSLSFLLLIIGIIGSFLPVIPGPPISWLGLLIMSSSTVIPFSWPLIVISLLITIGITILDYIIPAIGAKKFGGTKAGAFGTTIGLIIGIFIPLPFAILWCPFFGAFIAEIIYTSNHKTAFKAAIGSFLGFLAGTFAKFALCVVFLCIYIKNVFQYGQYLF
ncbi:DUF456 domain-containing protein [Zhouia sp. PK063]|uniref:DUF456 domain-containing protein n=1 Tax=Zhouia sp. PK063 TaxID=3373602 RepID=UPI003795BCE2